jgi:hypothetical protein
MLPFPSPTPKLAEKSKIKNQKPKQERQETIPPSASPLLLQGFTRRKLTS